MADSFRLADDDEQPTTGVTGVPLDIEAEVSEMIAHLAERYQFTSTTLAFFDVCATLARHIGDGVTLDWPLV